LKSILTLTKSSKLKYDIEFIIDETKTQLKRKILNIENLKKMIF